MAGFGSGSFGTQPFGQWSWSERVLYESIPSIYKEAQEDAGGYLKKYTQGQAPVFDAMLRRISEFDTLRDPYTARTAATEMGFFTLGRQIQPTGRVEQAGVLGSAALGVFMSADRAVLFKPTDKGKKIYIKRSSVAANNQQTFTIASVASTTTVFTDPPITPDAGPMRWELRAEDALPTGQVALEIRGGNPRLLHPGWVLSDGKKTYPIVSRQVFYQPITGRQLLNEREGADGVIAQVLGQTELNAASYTFQQQDVGKFVSIVSARVEKNTGVWEITAVRGGSAVFGRLVVQGLNRDPTGTVHYNYISDTELPITITHYREGYANQTLEVTYDEADTQTLHVRVRLATDNTGTATSTAADVVAAVNAHTLIAQYLSASVAVGIGLGLVSELSETPVKPGYLASESSVYWALRPFARIVVWGQAPLGTLEWEGDDLVLEDSTTLLSPSSPFQPGDVGKLLTLRGSTVGNDGTYEIATVLGKERVTLTTPLLDYASETTLYGAMRRAPVQVPDPTRLNPTELEVKGNASSLLSLLAYDFGLTLDSQLTDVRQRSWVRQISQLSELKGTPQSIEGAATLSGFKADVVNLYSFPLVPSLDPRVEVYYIPFPSRTFTAVSLSVAGDYAYLITAANTFSAADAGKVVQVRAILNNAYFLIEEVLSATEVKLKQPSIGGTLDDGVPAVPETGALPCSIGDVYTPEPYAFPKVDDINYDMLSAMYDLAGYPGSNRPGMDAPCGIQHIKIGYDFDGYSKSFLNCMGLGSEYEGTLIAKMAGTNGNNIQFEIVLGSQFAISVLGTLITATVDTGVTLTNELDAAISGLTVTNVNTSAGDVVITTSTPHGLPDGEPVTIVGVVTPSEANGTFTAEYINATQFRLKDSSGNNVYGASPYLGGGTAYNDKVTAYIAVASPTPISTPVSLPLSLQTFSGGVGANPPEVVSLDPAYGAEILTGDTPWPGPSAEFTEVTFYVQGEEVGAILGGPWKFVDSAGNTFFLNGPPEPTVDPLVFEATTTAVLTPPVPGKVYFEYICEPEYTCETCATSRALVRLAPDKVVEEGALALENAYERMIQQVEAYLPIGTLASYRLTQYHQTRAPLFVSGLPTLDATPFNMVWTNYARATYAVFTAADLSFFKVGLGGFTSQGAIRSPSASLSDLDIIQNYASRYASSYPNPPYTTFAYQAAITTAETVITLSGTAIHVSCTLEITDFNSNGYSEPVIREIGLFDTVGQMVAYGTCGGVKKTSERVITFEVSLVL